MSTTTDRAAAALGAIWDRRRSETLSRVTEVEDAVLSGLAGELEDLQRERARGAAHKLAGSAGTFGFVAAGEIARDLERSLDASGPPPPEECAGLADLVVALRISLEAKPGDHSHASTPTALRASAPVPASATTSFPASEAPLVQSSALTGSSGPVSPVETGGVPPLDLMVVGEDRERLERMVDEARARGLVAGVALSPWQARVLLGSRRPHVVLLDPVLTDGLEAALTLISDLAASASVLVLADPAGELTRVGVAGRGGRGFLPRDLTVNELVDQVAGLRERLRATATTILAVDDDESVLDAIRVVLEDKGLTVETCLEPSRLWASLERCTPDLLMLDLQMPGSDGLALCRAVRNDPRWSALPVLVLTARNDAETIEAVFDAGADDYVTKPFSTHELTARITNRLERVRLLRTLADTDDLTGLANRRSATARLETFRRLSGRGDEPLCVAVLNVDAFKRINTDLGRAGGDAVLRAVARALKQYFRGEDVVSRWGGDEFVVGMYGMALDDGRLRMAEFVEQIRTAGLDAGGGRRTATVSVGLAAFPTDGVDVESLYVAAERAVSSAKEAGGDRVRTAGQVAGTHDVLDVVIVEDDEILGDLLEHALVTRGYRTQRIDDGLRAVELLAGADPELRSRVIVLDWGLPSLDGLGVLVALADAGTLRRTRAIMLTARGSEREVLQTLEAGAHDHVTKPFSVPVLMQRIRRAIEEPTS